MRLSTRVVTGVLCVRYGTRRDVFNVEFAIYFALMRPFTRQKTTSLKQIFTTAKAAGYV